jgi:hypothetical protein
MMLIRSGIVTNLIQTQKVYCGETQKVCLGIDRYWSHGAELGGSSRLYCHGQLWTLRYSLFSVHVDVYLPPS